MKKKISKKKTAKIAKKKPVKAVAKGLDVKKVLKMEGSTFVVEGDLDQIYKTKKGSREFMDFAPPLFRYLIGELNNLSEKTGAKVDIKLIAQFK
jgi:hypothetical protein